ncbi:hypothetical protein H0E87_027414, partial [Populus deltoides]
LSISLITMRGWSDAHCQGTAFEQVFNRCSSLFIPVFLVSPLSHYWCGVDLINLLLIEDWGCGFPLNFDLSPIVGWLSLDHWGNVTRSEKGSALLLDLSEYLPVEVLGLASQLHLQVHRSLTIPPPSSHTCFYRLCFPPYPSMAIMQDRLRPHHSRTCWMQFWHL